MKRTLKNFLSLIFIFTVMLTAIGCDNKRESNNLDWVNGNIEDFNNETKIAEVGDIIKFGHYEQDGNYNNGKEPIEWIVLEVSNQKYLLLSKYVLAGSQYSYEDYTTFDESLVADYLEETFLYNAFDYFEEKKLLKGTITCDESNYQNSEKVFLLSEDEVRHYYNKVPNIYDCFPTKQAQNDVKLYNEDDYNGCYWWTRNNKWFFGTWISPDGNGFVGTRLIEKSFGIRPAIWLDFDYTVQKLPTSNVDSNFLGKWYVCDGSKKHTITISSDGNIYYEDKNDKEVFEYSCYSPTEISIYNNELVFVLEDYKIRRYDRSSIDDVYVYEKQ